MEKLTEFEWCLCVVLWCDVDSSAGEPIVVTGAPVVNSGKGMIKKPL